MTKEINKQIKVTKILTCIDAALAFLTIVCVIFLINVLIPIVKDTDVNGVLLEFLLLTTGLATILIFGITIALIVLGSKTKFNGGFANKTFIIYNAVLGVLPFVLSIVLILFAQLTNGSETIRGDAIFVLLGLFMITVCTGMGTLNTVEAVKIK